MREIKFRGKRLDNGEWVYGFLFMQDGKAYIITDLTPCGFIKHEVDPATVGQSTGMCDKNDKEIYEGDILANEGIPGRVEWDSLLLQFHCAWANFDFKTSGDIFYLLRRNYVAIGNIHDNPELLKEANDDE